MIDPNNSEYIQLQNVRAANDLFAISDSLRRVSQQLSDALGADDDFALPSDDARVAEACRDIAKMYDVFKAYAEARLALVRQEVQP